MARSPEYRAALRHLGAHLKENAGDTKIVSSDEAVRAIAEKQQKYPEDRTLLVCIPADVPTLFTDNITTVCSECALPIVHRPDVPVSAKKICVHCVVKYLNGDKSKIYVIKD